MKKVNVDVVVVGRGAEALRAEVRRRDDNLDPDEK